MLIDTAIFYLRKSFDYALLGVDQLNLLEVKV